MKRSLYNQQIVSFFVFSTVIHFVSSLLLKFPFNWTTVAIFFSITLLLIIVKVDFIATFLERFFMGLQVINHHLFMGFVFYLVLTPVGVIRKTFGKNKLKKFPRIQAETYLESPGVKSNNFEKPF